MAVGFAAAAANTFLDSHCSAFPWIQLHVGDPGSAGTSNPATETSRKQVTWASASGGSKANSAGLSWDGIAGSQDATHFSMWSASSGGTFGGSGTVTANPYTAGDDFVVGVGGVVVSVNTAA